MKKNSITLRQFSYLLVVGFVAMCGGLGIDLHLASMPFIAEALHTNQQSVQQSIAIYLLGMGVGQLFYGPLSDQYGRKPIVLIGLSIAVITSLAAAFVTDISSFLILRVLQGIGAGVCFGLGRTIVADMLEPEALAIYGSYFALVISLSPLLAPAIGGYIQHYFSWQVNFIVLGAVLFIAGLLYAKILPETNLHKTPNSFSFSVILENTKTLLAHRVFVGAVLCSGLAMGAAVAYTTVSSFMFQEQFHVSPVVYGWIVAATATGGVVGKFIAPFVIKRIGMFKGLYLGILLICFAGITLLTFATLNYLSVMIIVVIVFIAILGIPFIMSTAVPFALSPFHKIRGMAGAIYGFFQTMTAFAVSAIVGAVQFNETFVLAISYFSLGLIGIVIFYKLIYRGGKAYNVRA